MTPRYRALRLRALDGTLVGWGAFLTSPGGRVFMAAGFTGPLAWFRASALSLRLTRRGRP